MELFPQIPGAGEAATAFGDYLRRGWDKTTTIDPQYVKDTLVRYGWDPAAAEHRASTTPTHWEGPIDPGAVMKYGPGQLAPTAGHAYYPTKDHPYGEVGMLPPPIASIMMMNADGADDVLNHEYQHISDFHNPSLFGDNNRANLEKARAEADSDNLPVGSYGLPWQRPDPAHYMTSLVEALHNDMSSVPDEFRKKYLPDRAPGPSAYSQGAQHADPAMLALYQGLAGEGRASEFGDSARPWWEKLFGGR